VVRLSDRVCVDASAALVWERLARLEDIALWSEPVLAARCEGKNTGVGAERTCDLRGRVTIRERWVAWEEGRSFTYEGIGLPLVARATNTWTVYPEGTRTLLVTDAQVVLRGGLAGRMLEPLVRFQARRLGRRSLAAFKHLVETGSAPAVRHARLPRAPATC
jgi:hypothetical protein